MKSFLQIDSAMFSSFADVCCMEFNSILTIMLELFVLLTISVSGGK